MTTLSVSSCARVTLAFAFQIANGDRLGVSAIRAAFSCKFERFLFFHAKNSISHVCYFEISIPSILYTESSSVFGQKRLLFIDDLFNKDHESICFLQCRLLLYTQEQIRTSLEHHQHLLGAQRGNIGPVALPQGATTTAS